MDCVVHGVTKSWIRLSDFQFTVLKTIITTTLGGSDSRESACNAQHLSLIPGSGRYPGEQNGSPFSSFLENSMDRGACQLQSMELQRVGQDWETNTVCIWCEKMFQSNSLHAAVQVFQYHLWRRLSFLHCIFLRMLPLAIVQVPKLHEDGSSFVWDLVLYLFIGLLENCYQARRTLHSAILQLAKKLHTSLLGKSAKKLYGGVK